MSKTPYEIRMELLKLAKDSLFEPTHMKREAMLQEWHAARETDVNKSFPALPQFPSTNEIIAEATKLNAFVSDGR